MAALAEDDLSFPYPARPAPRARPDRGGTLTRESLSTMPSSRFEHISDVVSMFVALEPRSVLDVGCGFGRWGFLAREYCDIFHGRYAREEWTTRIEAVEPFEGYLGPHHRYVYDHIHVMTIQEYVADMPSYDVIYAGDVIEHLEKETAVSLLPRLAAKSNLAFIVSIPLGAEWPQGEVIGNPLEEHRSVWTRRDLKQLGARLIRTYPIRDGRGFAVAVWSPKPLPRFRNPYHRRLAARLLRRVRG